MIEPRSPLPSFKEIERQRRSYGNTVSLVSLKKIFLRQNTFFDDSEDSSDGSDYMETGLKAVILAVMTLSAILAIA